MEVTESCVESVHDYLASNVLILMVNIIIINIIAIINAVTIIVATIVVRHCGRSAT